MEFASLSCLIVDLCINMASSPLPTPANRPDSLEYSGAQQAQFDPNYRSFYHKEQLQEQAAVGEEDEGRIR